MFRVPEKYRITAGGMASTAAFGNNGAFILPSGLVVLSPGMRNPRMYCIASDGEGWEHVSVSLIDRVPTWAEMCFIKGMFWDPEDAVVQFHPPASQYVNIHPNCLHLWRPVGGQLLLPPKWMVG